MDTVASFSLVMDKDQEFVTDELLVSHPYQGQMSEFVDESSQLVRTFLEN